MKTTSLVLCFMLLLLLAPAAFMPSAMATVSVSKPAITVNLERYDPLPAEPGSVFDAWFGIQNVGTSVQNMNIRLAEEFPFSTEQGVVHIGIVPESEKILAHFVIKTDVAARNKDYNLTAEYQYGDNPNWWVKSTSLVQIRTSDASLSIKEYTVTPEQVAPGSSADISLVLENTGQTTVKDVDVKLDLKEPFSPLKASTTKRISAVKPGEHQTVSYSVIADPVAEPKVYAFPVEVSFRDDRNNKYVKTMSISMLVNAKPDVLVLLDHVDRSDEKATVTLKLVNRGATNIKYVTVHAQPQDAYRLASETQYLGNVDADDYAEASFSLTHSADTFTMPLDISFKDPYNSEFTMQKSVSVLLPPQKQPSRFWWVVLVVVIIGSIFYLRRKK